MNRDHARYEALAGAVLLGEADLAETARFAEHAATCGPCAEAADARAHLERLRAARDAESWRPDVRDALLSRLHERRTRNMRLTFGALAYAAGLSILLNLAAVSGLGDRLSAGFEDANRTNPAIPVAAARAVRHPIGSARALANVPHYLARPLTAPLPKRAPLGRSRDGGGRLGDVPDVLAGLVQPSEVTAERDLAVEPLLLCARGAIDSGDVACDVARGRQAH